jgi:Tfp pilus assembly PilM family ATPase
VDSLALADAAEACDFLRVGETVALIDIGAASTIIHFVKDGVSNFYRDVNWGSRELVGALTKSRRMDTAAAEQMLFELAEEKPGEFEPEQVEALEADDDEEPGGLIEGLGDEDSEGGELEALGGSSLDPLEDEVAEPTTRTSIGGGHGAQEEQSVEEILHMPLSRFAGELRRSFDYYEQQLYERPVDRVILSGGVAQVPYVRSAIRDELGLEHVEAANPCESALVLGPEAGISPMRKHPAVFMVAVGLAARGVSEL